MRIVAYLINTWTLIMDHLGRSFGQCPARIYYSLEELALLPDLSNRLILAISLNSEPLPIKSAIILAVSHLDLIEPLIWSLVNSGQRDLLLIINQAKRIPCAYELNCPLWDPQVGLMRKQALEKMTKRLNYLSTAFGIPVFLINPVRS